MCYTRKQPLRWLLGQLIHVVHTWDTKNEQWKEIVMKL